jgi:hypothetical protein
MGESNEQEIIGLLKNTGLASGLDSPHIFRPYLFNDRTFAGY